MRVFLRPSARERWSWRRIRSRTSRPGRGSCEGGGSLLEHSQLRGCHEPETAIRKQISLIEHGAVNLVTKHPQDSPHPRHGVQEALPTQRGAAGAVQGNRNTESSSWSRCFC